MGVENLYSEQISNSKRLPILVSVMKFTRLSCVEHVLTRPLTLREESRLRVFKNKILGRIFRPTWNENVEWRRPQN